jgi:hypothetical protein
MKWNHKNLTFYGFGENYVGPGVQQQNEGNCWARSMAALIGVSWESIALHAALDDLTIGQNNSRTAETVKAVNNEINKSDKTQKPFRIATAGRWFGPNWNKETVEASYPRAVGLTSHWVVVLGIGFNTKDQAVAVCFWDTDNQVKYADMGAFIGDGQIPELCFVRETRV